MGDRESDRRPNESERDWMTRITRLAGEQRRAQRDEAIEKRMKGAAAHERAEQIMNSQSDQDLNDFYKEFGIPFDDVQEGLQKSWYDAETAEAIKDVQQSVGKKTLFGGSKYKAMKRKHRKAIKIGAKQAKANKSWLNCSVVAIMLLGAFGGMGWGLYEAGSSIVSAMAR